MSFQHTTVLLNETVDAAFTQPDGLYVDGTFGRGGHARLLLSRLGPRVMSPSVQVTLCERSSSTRTSPINGARVADRRTLGACC